MSKTVGYVLTAALVVFAIAVPIIGPTALAAWGLSAGAVTAIGLALSAAIMVNSLLMPKPKVSNNAQETQLQLGEIARRAIFGKAATAGSLVDAFNYGGKYGTDHEVVIFALADHECESLEEFYVNDLKITYTGDGAYTQIDPTADSPHLYVYFRSGTEFQTLPSVVDTYGPGWTSSDNGAGICYVVVDYRADKPGNKKLAWPGGRPTFLWIVKGKKCYDPRLDDTVGGSGSHRWEDHSTWEYSENPIICHYNYERGIYACDRVDQPNMLLVGRGLTATEVPPANIFADANLCDEDPGDGGKRYTVGGVIAADETYLDVAEKFAAACGGIIIQPEGSVEIEPAQARTPSFSLTDDDILVGSTVEWNQQILSKADSEWVNTVAPRYVSPAQKWQDHGAPIRRVDADVLSDGGSREEDVVLQLVTVERQASDVGEIHRKLGRLWGRAAVVLGPEFAEVEEGDWGTWTSDRLGISLTFRVESYALDGKWQNGLKLREISSAVYDGVFGQGEATGSATDWSQTTAPIDTGAPDSANWTLTAVTLTDASGIETPALEITGDNTDDDSAEAIIVEYWKSDGVINPVTNPDDPTWSVFGTVAPTTTKIDITSIEGGAVYYAAVTYVVSGAPGDRLVLGPVTAGSTDISAAIGDSLVEGSNVTITDNGDGTFTVSSTGGDPSSNISASGNADNPDLGLSLTKIGQVLAPGAYTYSAGIVESPCVWWDDADSYYHMVFVAYTSGNVGSVGHAKSTDLVTWTQDSTALFSGSGGAGDPDENGVTCPYIVKEGGTYYLFYVGMTAVGYEAGTLTMCLATATSLSGPWTRHGTIIGLGAGTGSTAWRSAGIFHPSIVERDGTYYMFFNAKNGSSKEQIGYATSTDLLTWTVQDADSPVVPNGSAGTWNSTTSGDPSVYRVGDYWFMDFYGFNGTNASDGIAWTSDADFPLGWTQFAGNPILTKGASGAYDDTYAHKPFSYIHGAHKFHYYTSVGSSAGRGIALAIGATPSSLSNTGVAAGTYTNGNFTVDAQGRITAASDGAVPGALIPLVDGAEPPGLLTDGAGHLILVAGA